MGRAVKAEASDHSGVSELGTQSFPRGEQGSVHVPAVEQCLGVGIQDSENDQRAPDHTGHAATDSGVAEGNLESEGCQTQGRNRTQGTRRPRKRGQEGQRLTEQCNFGKVL